MAMSKRHFEALAKIVLDCGKPTYRPDGSVDVPELSVNQRWRVAGAIAGMAQIENPRFDRARFLKACGLFLKACGL